MDPNYKSYRDAHSRVVFENGIYVRYIFNSYKTHYDHLMNSGLYERLVSENLILKHEEVIGRGYNSGVYKIILPTQIFFKSYPFEWSYLQWKKAILCFLKINRIALMYGMILKDASPFNFYLRGSCPILFDTTSFIKYEDGNKWIAYRQFCEEFLSPIILIYYLGQQWSRISGTHLRGFPLPFVSKQLPILSWFNPLCLVHIHLHSKYFNKNIKNSQNRRGFTLKKLAYLIDILSSGIEKMKNNDFQSTRWVKYYSEDIQSQHYLEDKINQVSNWTQAISPRIVIDLGSNIGNFSFLVVKYAKLVVAIENDPICVDYMQKELEIRDIQNIIPLISELSQPFSALGILNKEYDALSQRINGDLVICLALIHHLCITFYMSFQHVSELLFDFTIKYLIIEFVPLEDEKCQLLVNGRDDLFAHYNEEGFEFALQQSFKLIKKQNLANSSRILYFFQKNMTK